MTRRHDPLRQALTDPVDLLLADVAIRVQLSRTDYSKAIGRYETINAWIERDGSPLKDRVVLFYPQGSMAIGATIASRMRTDEFDIDVVAQLDLPLSVLPKDALDLLFEAIRGEPGSRYYRMAKRRTRCVTVDYSDDMHLDVTPVVRMGGTPERQSVIFHHRAEAPQEPSYRLIANPHGFAEWFKLNTPNDQAFADIFEKRAWEYEEALRVLAEKAESEPVPSQKPAFRKSKAVIVLQLLKRWRNVQYDARYGRKPPSIMFAKLTADAANHTDGLSEELLHQARHMLDVFRQCQGLGELVHIANPVCPEDVLTDRWPGTLRDQAIFIDDLENLVRQVERLIEGCDLGEMQKIMIELFGEAPTREAFRTFNEQVGSGIRGGQSRYRTGIGGLVLPGAAAAVSTPSVATPKHTFFGADDDDR
ncbi:MAG: nucleotidyltransferase [Alphaproteobacteria bacterium]|nr:nucleotidyltransferase [Alphaproteobacteria bacterium]